MKRIYEPSFKYVPAASTSVAKTFARIRRELAAKAEQDKRMERISSVTQINRRTA